MPGTVPRPTILQSKLVLALSALLVGSLLSPGINRALRPVLRKAVKGGILAQRALVGAAAGVREDIDDIVAEAKSELDESAGDTDRHDGVPHHAHGSA